MREITRGSLLDISPQKRNLGRNTKHDSKTNASADVNAKPLVVRPRIVNIELIEDDELEKAVRKQLRDESEPVARGAGGKEPRLGYLSVTLIKESCRAP